MSIGGNNSLIRRYRAYFLKKGTPFFKRPNIGFKIMNIDIAGCRQFFDFLPKVFSSDIGNRIRSKSRDNLSIPTGFFYILMCFQ